MAEDNKNQKNIIPNNIDIGSIIKLIIIRSDGEIPKREDKDKKPAYSSKWKDPALLAQILKNTVEKLNDFYEKNKRAPTREEVIEKLNLGPIISAISKNELSEERILTYNDLLKRAGLPTNREQGVWNNEEFANEKNKKINEAVEKLNDFYEKNGRAPTIKEARKWLNLGPIISAISLNKLSEKGIFRYNDLLRYAGLDVNQEHKVQNNEEFVSKELDKVMEKLKEFYEKNGRAPKIKEVIEKLGLRLIRSFIYTLYRYRFIKHISYNELLKHTGLPVNIKLIQNWWKDPEIANKEINEAVEKLKEFYEKNGRAPTVKELNYELHLKSIIYAAFKNRLIKYGISSYMDLLKRAGLV